MRCWPSGSGSDTADHGNAEEVKNLITGDMDKEHSTNPVPFIVVGKMFEGLKAPTGDVVGGDLSLTPPIGMLADVAPTVLKMLDIPAPTDMTVGRLCNVLCLSLPRRTLLKPSFSYGNGIQKKGWWIWGIRKTRCLLRSFRHVQQISRF